MRQRIFVLVLVVLSLLPASISDAQEQLCFGVPGITNCIDPQFRRYWEQNGGLPVFGYPISPTATEQSSSGAFLVQYFERNRFELHPENAPPYNVLLGRLGADVLAWQGRNWQTFPKGTQTQGCLWFAETKHSVCDPFKSYWEGNGLQDPGLNAYARSLALFGLPLSEPAIETNAAGATVLTQWFERARFEWHPNNPTGSQVLLGLLGNEVRPNIPAPPRLTGDVMYPCTSGLCSVTLQTGQTRVVVPLVIYDAVLYGYARTSDGRRIVYATGQPTFRGEYADVYVAGSDGSNPRRLRRVYSLANGVGSPAGFGVIGTIGDGASYLYEDRAQIFVAQFDGAQERPVTPVLRYGASTTHRIITSSNGARLLYVPSLPFPRVLTYTVSNGLDATTNIDPYLAPAFWGSDENHIVVYRFNKPYDPEASNGANYDRLDNNVVGYASLNMNTGQTQPLPIDPSFRPVYSGAGGYTVLVNRSGTTALFNPSTGGIEVVSLPNFTLEADGRRGF
jgi:hypothetical protein